MIAVFITAFAYSQKIIVTNPRSGAKWYKGQTYTITWTKSGFMDSKVKIRLYQGGSKVLGITDKTENNGSFTWKVPTNLPDGNYVIRVKTVDNHVFDDSNIFAIAQKVTPAGTITITSPHSGDTWEKGKTYTIKWTRNGSMNENVEIRLYQGSSKVLSITDNTPNNGHYSWNIPASLPDGSYVVRVKTVDNLVFDDSDNFTIKREAAVEKAKITITSPHSGDEWQKGKTYNIKWNKTGNMNSNVKIILYQSSAKVLDIINTTPNSGSFM